MEYTSLKNGKYGVLLDTDIGPDCDDAGALALLCQYAGEYGFPILGVGHCTSNPYGAGCVDAIAGHLGFPDLSIGSWSGEGFLTDGLSYNREVAIRFSSRSQAGVYPHRDAAEMYQSILEKQADGSVVMIAIGPLNNLSRLLNMNRGLVESKVRALVCMAADIEERKEYNIICDVEAAKDVLEHWPAPIWISGFALGARLATGFHDVPENAEENPLFVAYDRYPCCRDAGHRHASFDLTAVDFAVNGVGEYWGETRPGKVEFLKEGATRFVEDLAGNVRFITQNAEDETVIGNMDRRAFGV